MKCEYCDSYLSTVPENGVCPNCGGVLTEQSLPKPPFRLLKVPFGFLEMGQDAVRLYMRFPTKVIVTNDVSIPYDQIYDVSYIPATKWHKGILSVQSWERRYIPLPRTFGEHKLRDPSVYFEMKDSSYAGHAYTFLKQWAERNRMQEGKRREM